MKRIPLVILALILLTGAAYGPVVRNGFIIFDDLEYIQQNPMVKGGLGLDAIVWAFTTFQEANWHPLAWISHMLDVDLHGLDPGGHHLTSLIIHVLNTVLLFLVLRSLTGAVWKSGAVAALFAVHPLHVESVAWVAERKDVLSTFFGLVALGAYARYARRPAWPPYLGLLAAYTLSLMSKPMLVTLPFLLLLVDFWPLGRLAGGARIPAGFTRRSGTLLLEKVPLFLLAAAASIVTWHAQSQGGLVRSLEQFPFGERLGNVPIAYWRYIGKMFWPRDLSIFYPPPTSAPPAWLALGAALVLGALLVLTVKAARRHPYLPVGLCWFLGMLVPVIGLVQVGNQALADRYTYLPLTGLFIAVAWGIGALTADRKTLARPLAALGCCVVVALAWATHREVGFWRDDRTLFSHAIATSSPNYLAQNILGMVLYREGKTDEAIAHYREAIRLRPAFTEAHNNLGLALARQGKAGEALAEYRTALRLDPKLAMVHNNLGLALFTLGQAEEAKEEYRLALRLKPNQVETRANLGLALAREGDVDGALAEYRAAVRFRPDLPNTHFDLAQILAGVGRVEEAVVHSREAVRLKPDDPVLHNSLGANLARAGKQAEAEAQFRRALVLRADYPEALFNLGLTLSAQDRDEDAQGYLRQALASRPDDPDIRNNLGVVLSKLGQLPEAAAQFQQALNLRPEFSEAAVNLRRARAYLQGEADREQPPKRSRDD